MTLGTSGCMYVCTCLGGKPPHVDRWVGCPTVDLVVKEGSGHFWGGGGGGVLKESEQPPVFVWCLNWLPNRRRLALDGRRSAAKPDGAGPPAVKPRAMDAGVPGGGGDQGSSGAEKKRKGLPRAPPPPPFRHRGIQA